MFIGQTDAWNEQKKYQPSAVALAFTETQGYDLGQIAAGRYDLKSVEGAFFLIQDRPTKKFEEARVEAHRDFIDIQYLIKGIERFGMAHRQANLKPVEDLMDEKDIAFYPTPTEEFIVDLKPGQYVIFFPGELHRPCCSAGAEANIRKVVVKVPHKEIAG